MKVLDRLHALNLSLPPIVAPLAAYVPVIETGPYIITAGQIPLRDGQPIATGRIGHEITTDIAVQCARQCALNALAAANTVADLDVLRVVKVTAYIACSDAFDELPTVANGASELLVDALGEAGKHVRTAVGVRTLPLHVPIEIDFQFEKTTGVPS